MQPAVLANAIFELGVAAAAPDGAESAGDVVCDAAPRSRRMRTTAPTTAANAASAVPAMATTLLSPRLFEQRLDEGLDLLAVERLALGSRAGRRGPRTRWGGNGHASQRFTNKLVLLVH